MSTTILVNVTTTGLAMTAQFMSVNAIITVNMTNVTALMIVIAITVMNTLISMTGTTASVLRDTLAKAAMNLLVNATPSVRVETAPQLVIALHVLKTPHSISRLSQKTKKMIISTGMSTLKVSARVKGTGTVWTARPGLDHVKCDVITATVLSLVIAITA
jgi:hypothetical protein